MIYILYECDICEASVRSKNEMPPSWGLHVTPHTRTWLVCEDCQKRYEEKFNTKMKIWGENNE